MQIIKSIGNFSDELLQYNLDTNHFKTIKILGLKSGHGSKSLQLENEDLVIIGGGLYYYINNYNILIELEWPRIESCRRWPGIISLNFEIFVFGGLVNYDRYLDSSLKYNIISQRWQQISSIPEPMSACNPINHKGLIYLGGGQKNERFSSNTIYKYCPNIDKWFKHIFNLPLNLAFPVILFSDQTKLSLLQVDKINHYSARRSSTQQLNEIVIGSWSQPLFINGKYYITGSLANHVLWESSDQQKNIFRSCGFMGGKYTSTFYRDNFLKHIQIHKVSLIQIDSNFNQFTVIGSQESNIY